MPDALRKGPATARPGDDALVVGFLKVGLQQKVERGGDDGQNDGEAAETPSPVDVEVEALGSLGSGEGGNHVRGRGEGKGDTSVPQVCGIGREHTNGVDDASETDLVENLSRHD